MSASRSPRWWPLVVAAGLLPFANGFATVPLAAWLSPIFLLRFVRTQRTRVGLPIAYALLVAALALQFRGLAPIPGVLYWVVMAATSIPAIVPFVLDRWLGPRLGESLARVALFPLAATAMQFVTSFGRYGSWGNAAYSQYGNLSLLQLASVTGLWGIDFLIFAAAPVANAVWERGLAAPMARRAAAGYVALLALVLLGGGARLRLFAPSGRTVRVASLSHAEVEPPPEPATWARIFDGRATAADGEALAAWAKALDDDLLARADREAAAGAKLVFWDETGAVVLARDEPALLARGRDLAARRHIYLGMSIGTWTLGDARPLQNKLVLIGPDGSTLWTYHKAEPVPGIEAPWVQSGDGKLRAVDTPYGRLSAIICHDADYPRLVAQAGAMRADILLDPSSDWRALDPWHTQMASLRAIEQGVTLVRQTSDGLSAAYDPHGVPLATMDHFRAGERVLVAQLPTAGVPTVYARLGDWFAWLCVAAVVVVLASCRRARAAHGPRVESVAAFSSS